MIANFFLGLFYNFSAAYKLTDKTHLGGYIALVGAAITLSVNIIFIPVIDIYAPAWAALACYFVMAVGGYWVSRKYYPIPYQVGHMIYYLLLGVAIFGLSYLINQQWTLSLWPKMALHSLFFGLYLGILFSTERKWLKSVLSS